MSQAQNLHCYHAKYLAHALSLIGAKSAGVGSIGATVYNAKVDINPHQIEAALFAMQSSFSKGTLLADEVGLGKTIEAGLVLCQYWAEHKRRLLVICPATLRVQWATELSEKFNLPTLVLDKKVHASYKKEGKNVWAEKSIKLISYEYARTIEDDIRQATWDLVVIDEAHRLRRSHLDTNKTGQSIIRSTQDCRKLLLTATPLQNSMDDLYSLANLIDPYLFGDIKTFRSKYGGKFGKTTELHERLKEFMHRTLRKDVLEYISYTERSTLTESFTPSEDEHAFYELMSEFVSRPDSYAIPKRQRHLMQLVLRKMLASSSVAVVDTLRSFATRLQDLLDNRVDYQAHPFEQDLSDLLADSIEDVGLSEAFEVEDSEATESEDQLTVLDFKKIKAELGEIHALLAMANHLGVDAKTHALIKALNMGFKAMANTPSTNKPAQKALIFTESRRTQTYLFEYLNTHGYADKVVCFNGGGQVSPQNTLIYENWLAANQGNDKVTGTRQTDMRTALVEHFRDQAIIMIATEAAAEGVNLQFCSLVVNYDLPWNPQRIEQRIGRCHRYGQKHDVVVINFLNKRNEVDKRVLELLTEKFELFESAFGASDEVLGLMDGDIDFEKKVLAIYQECRTPETIEASFQALRKEMEDKIQQRMDKTNKTLLEHFDGDVHERLAKTVADTQVVLDTISNQLWRLTQWQLGAWAQFNQENFSFRLSRSPIEHAPAGVYHLRSTQSATVHEQLEQEQHLYRLSHPLGRYVIDTAKTQDTPIAHLVFDVSNQRPKISALTDFVGQSGYLILSKLTLSYGEQTEEYLLFSGHTETGEKLGQDRCQKLFECACLSMQATEVDATVESRLVADNEQYQSAQLTTSKSALAEDRKKAMARLDAWEDDKKQALNKALDDIKQEIRSLRKEKDLAETVEEQESIKKKIKQKENEENKKEKSFFDEKDAIRTQRETVEDSYEKRLKATKQSERVMLIQWTLQ